MEERTTIQGLLNGALTRDADPAAWDDDAYLFAKSRAWADDRDWMLEQLANPEFPVTHRMDMAMYAGGQDAVTQAYTAIAATSPFRSDVADCVAMFERWIATEAAVIHPDDSSLQERALVAEVYASDQWRELLENEAHPLQRRKVVAWYGLLPAFNGLRRALNRPS